MIKSFIKRTLADGLGRKEPTARSKTFCQNTEPIATADKSGANWPSSLQMYRGRKQARPKRTAEYPYG